MATRRSITAQELAGTDEAIGSVRDLTLFYSGRLEILERQLARSPFTMTEVRVLHDLARRTTSTATEIAGGLSLDPGCLSRLLKKLEKRHHIRRVGVMHDARQRALSLTDKGRRLLERLHRAAREAVAGQIEGLSPAQLSELLDAMHTIRRLLSDDTT
jgi:DNA-binding MarR family transcriptional regulator